jgi:hypothetical protein
VDEVGGDGDASGGGTEARGVLNGGEAWLELGDDDGERERERRRWLDSMDERKRKVAKTREGLR